MPPESLSPPPIAVVLATYNGARYLRELLESLAQQTRLPSELIVSDDGSTDATLDVVRDFTPSAPFPVRLHQNEARLGYTDNFLQAMEKVAAPLVAFCDQDDVWLPRKLERCGAALLNPAVTLAVHNAHVTDSALTIQRPLYADLKGETTASPRTLDPFMNPLGFTMVFRREHVARFDGRQRPRNFMRDAKSRLCHDQWVYFLSHAVGRIALIAEPLALYRQHGGNAFGVASGPTTSLQDSRSTDVIAYEERRDGCLDYAAFWGAQSALPDSLRAEAEAATAYYGRLARRFDARVRLNRSRNLARRCATLFSLAVTGGYRARGRGGLGSRAFVKDSLRVVRGARSPS